MKALRGLLKFLGYSAFFLVALVLFVYLTLPLGEVEDYLVRKAADEYNADLTFNEDDSLDTCGLTCVEATNVTVKFRASPEEQTAYAAKRKVYLDWKKAQRAAATGKTGADAAAPGSKAGAAAGEKTTKVVAKLGAKADKNAPENPENPSKTVELDRLKLAAAPLKLLSGAIDGTLEAELIGGSINAAIVQGEEEIALDATISDLDASKLDMLRSLIDLPIVGTLGSEIDLKLPLKENAKGKKAPDLTAVSGTVGLSIANAAVGPGQIKTNSKTGFPFFDVPKTRITRLGGQIVFARKRATFEKFKISGKDLEGELTGYATLMAKLKDWRLNGHLNLKFSDTFLTDNRDVKVAMSSSPYLRRGQSNGYTGFNIHGTVGNVKFRPRKKAASTGRGAKKSRASKRPRKKKTAIDRKGRSKKKRPGNRTKTGRPTPKRSAKAARAASPKVRKGRATTDEPEPEDDEPEPEDDEPESDEPEGDDGESNDDAKDKDGDDEESDGEDDEKGDDEEKEE